MSDETPAAAQDTPQSPAVVESTESVTPPAQQPQTLVGDGEKVASDKPQEPVAKEEPKADAKEEMSLALPEDSLLDNGAVERIAGFAKEQGLSKEQAQKILESQNELVKAYAEKQVEEFRAMRQEWYEATVNDKELGGAEFKAKAETAHRAAKKFASEEFLSMLNETGYGNHPEVVRLFYRIGLAMGEDKLVQANAQAGTKARTYEDIFYGNKQ